MFKVSRSYVQATPEVINCCHGDGRHIVQSNTDYQATMLVIVINCLRLSVVVIYCYHSDGSDGRHVCTKYHGHTHYLLVHMLEVVA